MFNKNDPLISSVQQVMKENAIRRSVEQKLNEELGIASKKALPHEHHKNYDALLEERIAEALSEGKVDSDTYKAQNIYDKAHSEAKKKGHSDSEAHSHALSVMRKSHPDHSATSGEGQVYKKMNESLGGIPKTPREKDLAAKHGNPNRITKGDVLKARGVLEDAEDTKKSVVKAASVTNANKDMNVSEEEQLDEVGDTPAGKKRLGDYVKDASRDVASKGVELGRMGKTIGQGIVGKKADIRIRSIARATNRLTKEEHLEERKMSDEDMAKREKIVKSMKKNMAGFKARYGKRAKDVMYATATKQAMKESTDIDSIMEEIAFNLNEKAKEMLKAPFHEAAEWFNSLNEEQVSMLEADLSSIWSGIKSAASNIGSAFTKPQPSTPAGTSMTSALTGNQNTPAPKTNAAREVNATTSTIPASTPQYGGGQMGNTPSAVKSQTQPTMPKPATPAASSAPRTSERVASQQAGVPDSRNLRAAVKPEAGEGETGKALAAAGVSKADRMNPNFLKSQGITDKPGSAAANLALNAKMQAQRSAVSSAENPKSAANAPSPAAKPAAPTRPGQSVSGIRPGASLGGGVR